MQEGDVLLYQTNDGGEVDVVEGFMRMSGGLETAAYLSLFGGNQNDDGRADAEAQWWGNLTETESEKQYRGETQYLLDTIAAIPANLRRLEDAARRDLAWFVSSGAATSIEIAATMPGLNKVMLSVSIIYDERETSVQFLENWRADA